MGYVVKNISFYSYDDNKKYEIPLPSKDRIMLLKFLNTIKEINTFDVEAFIQTNVDKCNKCVYSVSCDRSLV